MLFTNRPTPNAIAEQGPEVDFDLLLSEMNHIEGNPSINSLLQL